MAAAAAAAAASAHLRTQSDRLRLPMLSTSATASAAAASAASAASGKSGQVINSSSSCGRYQFGSALGSVFNARTSCVSSVNGTVSIQQIQSGRIADASPNPVELESIGLSRLIPLPLFLSTTFILCETLEYKKKKRK